MQKFLTLIAFLGLVSFTQASENAIPLPCADTITKYLHAENLGHVSRHTTIEERLGGKTLKPSEVAEQVHHALVNEFAPWVKEIRLHAPAPAYELTPIECALIYETRSICCILQDHPSAIEQLKKLGTLK